MSILVKDNLIMKDAMQITVGFWVLLRSVVPSDACNAETQTQSFHADHH